ncbi:MAG: phosphoserine aminotransferase, partial [Pseudomonadota bacterium]
FLAVDPATRSNTSVCLKFTDPRIADGAGFAKAVAKRLEAEGVAYDIGAYRDAPPGLRIWCGGTVETADLAALMPWLSWAFEAEISAQSQAA